MSLAGGVVLAACLLGGPRLSIGAFIAAVMCVAPSQPLWIAALLAASQVGLAALCAVVMRRRDFDVRLERPSDLATLVAVAIPVVAMADALIATIVLRFGPQQPSASVLAGHAGDAAAWLVRSAGNAIGATLVVPVVLLAASMPQIRWSWRRTLEFVLFTAGLVFAVAVVPNFSEDGGLVWPIALCLGTPFIILLVVRFARWGSLVTGVVVGGSLVSGLAIDQGEPLLATAAIHELATIGLWVMTLAIVAISMLLGVTIAAHRTQSAEVAAVAARLRHVVEAARLGYWQFDAHWRTELINARLATMLGTTESAMVGRHLLELVSDRARDDAMRQLREIERGDRNGIELECRRPDGRVAWLGLQVTRNQRGRRGVLSLRGAEHFGAIAAVDDLAERRRAEAERLKLETSMLNAQKLESLGVLAGGLAHDFNNIVMGIRGNAGLLRVSGGERDAQGCADRIEALCQRAAELVSTLLAYAGKGEFSMRRISLPGIAREAIGITRLAAPPNVRVELEGADQQIDVTADPHHLRQMLVGVMANAVEALPATGGRVRVRCRTLTSAPNGPTAELEIVDDGAGMGEATLARVFEPFFSTKGLGRGLGMSAALGIARRLGGSIAIDSRPGAGTTVRLRLPLADEPAPSQNQTPRGHALRRPTAVLTEPEPGLRELMAAALEIRGFTVALDRDLASALSTIEDRPTGVLVAHAGRSVLSALNSVRAARARGCDVPIVLTSDHRDSVVIDASDTDTIWLQRPFDVRRLLDAIDNATGVRTVPSGS